MEKGGVISKMKKRTGIKSQKLYKQVKDQSVETRWNSVVVIEEKMSICYLYSDG